MRIHEILGEKGAECPFFIAEGTDQEIDQVVRSVLIPLKSQKVEKITVKQFMDNLTSNPTLQGLELDQEYVVGLLGKYKQLISKVQADPENEGLMTIYFDFPQGERQIDAKQAEKEKQDINKAALRAIKDKQKT